MILSEHERKELERYKRNCIQTDTEIFQLLLTASGMEYFSYFYNLEYWNKKLSKDISGLFASGYLTQNNSGLLALTGKAKKHLQAYYGQVKSNWQAIGIQT